MSWRATLRRMQVLRAVEQPAADDTPITAIAHQVGYGSLSAFNAAFVNSLGRRQRTTAPRSPAEPAAAPTATRMRRSERC